MGFTVHSAGCSTWNIITLSKKYFICHSVNNYMDSLPRHDSQTGGRDNPQNTDRPPQRTKAEANCFLWVLPTNLLRHGRRSGYESMD
jgi:hypothetical protein